MTNKCKRCGRPIKDPLADYGPVCGLKVAAEKDLQIWTTAHGKKVIL